MRLRPILAAAASAIALLAAPASKAQFGLMPGSRPHEGHGYCVVRTPQGGVLQTTYPCANAFGPPFLRAWSISFVSSTSQTVSMPAGSAIGDEALVCLTSGNAASSITSGWTAIGSSGASTWVGACWTKTLASGDLSSGVTIGTGGGAFDMITEVVVFVGGAQLVAMTNSQNGSGSSSISLAGPSGALVGQRAIYIASNRAADLPTVSNGNLLQQLNDGANGGAAIYSEVLPAAGAISRTYSYPTAGSGNYQAFLVFKCPTC